MCDWDNVRRFCVFTDNDENFNWILCIVISFTEWFEIDRKWVSEAITHCKVWQMHRIENNASILYQRCSQCTHTHTHILLARLRMSTFLTVFHGKIGQTSSALKIGRIFPLVFQIPKIIYGIWLLVKRSHIPNWQVKNYLVVPLVKKTVWVV